MNTEQYEAKLTAREHELLETMQRYDEEARESRVSEVEDVMDAVTSSIGKATAFEESTLAEKSLQQVQAALSRIQDGTYGRCLDCGREIESARLEAVPWAAYCLKDQEKHDREDSAGTPTNV